MHAGMRAIIAGSRYVRICLTGMNARKSRKVSVTYQDQKVGGHIYGGRSKQRNSQQAK